MFEPVYRFALGGIGGGKNHHNIVTIECVNGTCVHL